MKKRDEFILQLINQQGKVSVNELSERCGVSVETIRRDLNYLSKKGLLYRVHGSAVCHKTTDVGHSFQIRQKANQEEKKIIANLAMEYVFEGAVIGLDASTTSWYFAQLLPDIPCTIVTNSMHNISALVNKTNIKTISTGGVYSPKYDAFYGPLSEQILFRLHLDIGIFSCIGIDDEGNIWESNELNVSVKRKIMDACEQKFLLADHSKIGRKNLIKLADLSQIDIFFTNRKLNYSLKECCNAQNVLVYTL